MSDDETVYVAERICGKKVMNKRTFYLVKWDGYSEAENTWEPLENFKSPVLIHEYDRECREREKERIRLIKIENGDGTPVRASTAKQNYQVIHSCFFFTFVTLLPIKIYIFNFKI
jgi:hypothetical protein